MTQGELVGYLAEALDAAGVEYMIGGSHASIYYGETRLTRDVDVVAALTLTTLPALLDRFPPAEFYVDSTTAEDAVRSTGQFNIIHPASGFKIDVYVNPDTPYDRARLERRRRLPLGAGTTAWFAAPEDVILYGADLDQTYLREWVSRLGLASEWNEVQARLT